jgi:CHAT domain-containing protein
LLDAGQQPVETGRVYAELADVLAQLDLENEAIDAAKRGVELLPPASAPHDATRVGGRLGDLLSRKGDWEEAAAAFRVAVEAAELAFHSRLDREFRQREASSTINLTRWASFALAAAGDIPEALMVLESGRTREMRQRLGLGEIAARELDELPDNLRTRYVEALDELAASPIGEASAAASRRLHEALRDIREVSGFEQFGTRTHPGDLVGALERDWPLLYVNPTPMGTLLLLVEKDGDDATVDAYFLEEPTSLEVLMRLLAGEGAESMELLEKEEAGSYLAGASGFGARPRDLQRDVEHVLPWFGQSLSEPINDVLSDIGARGVTLVCCGPVGLAPLHAAPWNTEKGGQCLIDRYEIRYVPSGAFAAASLSRAAERGNLPRVLVAVADPHGDLPSAKPEVEALSRHFGEQSSVAVGPEATWPFLVERAADATHLHLACHARSAVWGEEPPAVLLSDGTIDVAQLTELAELPSRLVVVSACQSAVMDISHLPEEAISIGSVLLAAGAACVVASLWPVRDDTTALLMNRLYEEMFENNLRPPEALRRAQLWLRDLTDAEVDVYLREHPVLEREFERRATLGDRPGHRAPAQEGSGDITSVRPFSASTYWAPFIAIGA